MSRPDWLPDWISITGDRISWWDGGAVGVGKRCQTRRTKPAAAEELARSLMATAARTAGLSSTVSTTWTDLCHAWVHAHDGKIAEGTLRRRISAINVWVIPHAGHVAVGDTTLATLLTVADAAADKGLGMSAFDSTVQSMMVVASWGWERNWLPADAFGAEETRRRALRTVRQKIKSDATAKAQSDGDSDRGITVTMVPTWDDVCLLADAMTDRVAGLTKSMATGQRYGRAVRVAAGTGLRLCELLGLHTDQVDLTTGLIEVRHQLDRYKPWDGMGPMPTVGPKYGRRRTVGAWAKISEDLEAAVASATDDGVLFGPFDGQAWWADAWGRHLHTARTGIGWAWAPHWLRHHYGSVSLAPRERGGLGLAGATVQSYLGHKNLTTTLDTYGHEIEAPKGWIS
jgi:hypothetical protein